ncbi:MAG: bifunctional metallophosphatase/5'-nucleotidase [Bacteroidales bacterium]
MSEKINILQLNDVHGYMNLHNESYYEARGIAYRKSGGYARIATLINQIKSYGNATLLFDCGDTFHGTFPVVDTQGEILTDVLNDLDISAMTGHWDFAYGPKQLQVLLEKLNYPFLAANIYTKGTDALLFDPTVILEKNGIKIGVIGLACNIVDKTMPASFSEGIYFTDGTKELSQYIDQLKHEQEADLIVLISHNGFPQEVELVKQNPGIDICLSSHTHNRLYKPVVINNTIIIQSGAHGSFLGSLEITLDENKKIADFSHQLIEVSESTTPDKDLQQKIGKLLEPYKYLDEKVGETDFALHRNLSLECTMDNFLLQSMMAKVPADVYFSNGWRYGTPIPRGDVTLNDLYNIVPMNPPISTVTLSGEELLKMIEENLDKTYNNNPLQQMGGYVKRALGIKIYFKAENPNKTRVQSAFVNGEKVDPMAAYTAAFITSQGVPERYGKNRMQTNFRIVEAMQQYLAVNSPLKVSMYKTFELI